MLLHTRAANLEPHQRLHINIIKILNKNIRVQNKKTVYLNW